jgi:uncharacterized protein (DUF2267 family)
MSQNFTDNDLATSPACDKEGQRTKMAFDDAAREIVKVLRKHVDRTTLERILDDLLDIPGNKSFRDLIEKLASELRTDDSPDPLSRDQANPAS